MTSVGYDEVGLCRPVSIYYDAMSIPPETTIFAGTERSIGLAAAMETLVAEGEGLRSLAEVIAEPGDVAVFRREHRAWALRCLPVLSRGFESESVGEFLRVNARYPQRADPPAAARAAAAVLRDALELLRSLRSTIGTEHDPP